MTLIRLVRHLKEYKAGKIILVDDEVAQKMFEKGYAIYVAKPKKVYPNKMMISEVR